MSRPIRIPTVFQMEAAECGAASLCMICAHFGKFVPLEQMRVETGVSRDGSSASNVKRAAEKLGLECHGLKMEPQELKNAGLPCILHWNFAHFLVLEGFSGQYAILNDPAVGRRRVSMQELDECFTGVALTFRPTQHFVREKNPRGGLALLKERFFGQKIAWKLLALGLAGALPCALVPLLGKVFLDEILACSEISLLPGIIFASILAAALRAILSLCKTQILSRACARLSMRSARSFLEKLFRLPADFFAQRYAGDIVERAHSSETISLFCAENLAEELIDLVCALCMLALLFAFSPILASIGLLGLVCCALSNILTHRLFGEASAQYRQDMGRLVGALCAGLGVTATLKASGAQDRYSARVMGLSARADAHGRKISRAQAALSSLPGAIGALFGCILLIWGCMCILQGKMTPGTLAAILALYVSLLAPVQDLCDFAQKLCCVRADLQRTEDVLRHPQDPCFARETPKHIYDVKLSGQISCKNLRFGYSPLADPLLQGIAFSANPGEMIAFVGASGSGKSTVGKLLGGLYRPWSGEIALDGAPLQEIPAPLFHASVASVGQKPSLFAGTIRDNIRMWNPAVLEKDIIAAAKDACIHEDITQKAGAYDHLLTEGGSNLSGGQRQRLEIARALATNPTILLLDEATSALDPLVEQKILQNIRRRGCTCLIAAHRLSAVRSCDKIIVLGEGKILETGTHDELCAHDGPYRQLMDAK